MNNDTIQLDQAFFGNAQSGYRLLASTDNRFSTDVANYCNAIGTPDGFSEIEPFLFSVPRNNVLMMFCCQPGQPDASGRKTLFVHAIIVEREKADAFNINAYSLYEAGFFSKSLFPNCRPIELDKALKQTVKVLSPFAWNGESLAIISGKPETELIRGLLGHSINTISWSSFSYQPLVDFRLYVISKYINRPSDRKCILPSGEILPQGMRETSSQKSNQDHSVSTTSKNEKHRIARILLVLSVLVNLALAYILLTTPKTRVITKEVVKEVPVEKIVCQGRIEYRDREVIKEVPVKVEPSVPPLTREQILADLRKQFPPDKQIPNFDDIVRISSRLQSLQNNPRPEHQEVGLISKISAYISFVNTYILNISQTKGDNK